MNKINKLNTIYICVCVCVREHIHFHDDEDDDDGNDEHDNNDNDDESGDTYVEYYNDKFDDIVDVGNFHGNNVDGNDDNINYNYIVSNYYTYDNKHSLSIRPKSKCGITPKNALAKICLISPIIH